MYDRAAHDLMTLFVNLTDSISASEFIICEIHLTLHINTSVMSNNGNGKKRAAPQVELHIKEEATRSDIAAKFTTCLPK